MCLINHHLILSSCHPLAVLFSSPPVPLKWNEKCHKTVLWKVKFNISWDISLVIYSESEIIHHDKQYEPFYSSFVALSAHYITTVCGQSKYYLFLLWIVSKLTESMFEKFICKSKAFNNSSEIKESTVTYSNNFNGVSYVSNSYSKQILFFSACLVPRNQLLSVAAACKVLIEFSLLRLENPDEACAVSQVRETN